MRRRLPRHRGDIALELSLLRRPRGILGIITVIGGGSAIVANYLPWYEVLADITMLGESQRGAVATLSGWQAQPWSWLAPPLALIAVGAGALISFDRAGRRARDVAMAAGGSLILLASASALAFPPVERFDLAGTRLRELTDLREALESIEVQTDFVVAPGSGLWLTLAAAGVILASMLLVRDG